MTEIKSNYSKFRGKCKEEVEKLIAKDPSLKIVRGYYYEPLWNKEEEHWWCVNKKGEIIDPTRKQFPSRGISSFYREFNGYVKCENCGKEIKEEEIIPAGNYAVCSVLCACKLVGL